MKPYTPRYSSSDQLTIDDLQAYLAGRLGGAAHHRVERIVLENPFYADALEGLSALHQAGENLHSHTRELHSALEARVEASATPRRLMPLWLVSAIASIVLVLCVALYYFFYVLPARSNVPAGSAIEPGTVLIDTKVLGIHKPAATTLVTAKKALDKPRHVPGPQPATQQRTQPSR